MQPGSGPGCPPSLSPPPAYACAAMRQTRHAARAAAERLSAGAIAGQKGPQSGGRRSGRMRSLTLSAPANFSDAALQARVVALLRLLRPVSHTEHTAAADSSNMRHLPCQQRTLRTSPFAARVPTWPTLLLICWGGCCLGTWQLCRTSQTSGVRSASSGAAHYDRTAGRDLPRGSGCAARAAVAHASGRKVYVQLQAAAAQAAAPGRLRQQGCAIGCGACVASGPVPSAAVANVRASAGRCSCQAGTSVLLVTAHCANSSPL